MSHPNIIFMGTPEFAKVILQTLVEADFPILAVFAQPDKPAGRGKKLLAPPVAEYAKEKKLPLYQPSTLKDESVREQISSLNADYIIVAAYGKILPQIVLNAPKKDCLNVHASLLPKYRGASPIHAAILHGEQKTGASIMRVVKELDAGPVYMKKELDILSEDTTETLTKKLAELGGEALIEAIQKIENENLKPVEQNHEQASYAPKLDKSLTKIDWTKSNLEIFNQIRAFLPWPVAETELAGKRLRIFKASLLSGQTQAEPGTILHTSQAGWTLATGSGQLLVEEVQLEGKKRMRAFDVANGLRLSVGMILGKG